jgi:potassium/hydrogen antiporter
MLLVDQVIFFGSLLILVAIISRKFSTFFGIPVLVLFLLVGMLAGSEGIGGIEFENYSLAHAAGTLALVVILFDGGLRTRMSQIRLSWKPALTLATLGVLITALITGFAAAWLLNLPPLTGLLLGSIVASTDAPAVFSVLRTQSVTIDERLQATLEVESGSNDPMAIFLTVGLLEVILGQRSLGMGLFSLFVLQMGVGLVAGYGMGRIAVNLINRIKLDAAGLYPVLVVALGLLTYGLAVFAKGSGFLAVYVAGIVIGNGNIVFHRGTLLFHDGIAWISQIVMFIVLGLLSFPSALIGVAQEGLIMALVIIFVSRPLAVTLLLLPFRFNVREMLFLSWVGLKGAVPIILGIFPLLYGLPNGLLIFNVVFFAVIVSVMLQGWPLPAVARILRLQRPPKPEPSATLEITSLRHIQADILDYEVRKTSAAAHLRISELAMPEDVVIAMITRGNDIIPARGATVLLPGDHVFVILKPERRPDTDALFAADVEHEVPLRAGVYLPGKATLKQLGELYDIVLHGDPDETLEHFVQRRWDHPLEEGSFVEADGWRLYVQAIDENGVCTIGVEEAI